LDLRIGDKKVLFPIPPRYTKKNVVLLKQLIEAGRYRAVIDRSYPGNVVLTINGGQARRS
jgi:hypothetical protein